MKYLFLLISCLSLHFVRSQGKYAVTYYVDRVVHYNEKPNYSAEEVFNRWDEYVRFQADQSISENDEIRIWIDLDPGWNLNNLELAYSRIFQGFNTDIFYRRNIFYADDYDNYADDYENQPTINQLGFGLGYGGDRGIISYKIASQFTIGLDSKKITYDHTFYTSTNYRTLNEEIFQIKDFRTLGVALQLGIRLIEREKWDFGLNYQFYVRRDFFDFANQSSRYEWTRNMIVRQEIYTNSHRYDRIQNRFGFTLGLN
jgi:hypothetical protein